MKFLGHGGGNLLTFFREDQLVPDDHGGFGLPDEWGDWANETLLPAWRVLEERREAHKREEWDLWITKVFRPRFPGLDYGVEGATQTYYDLPAAARAMIDETFGGPRVARKVGEYLPLPPELRDVMMPPRAPAGFAMYYRDKDGDWIWIDPKASATLDVPEDPILRRDREFFAEVWEKVGSELGSPLPAPEEVKNGYGGVETWRSFRVGDAEFTVGWRRRVVSIRVRSREPFPTEGIRSLAVGRDGVTYMAYMGSEEVDIDDLTEDPDTREILRKRHPDGKVRTRVGGYNAEHAEANEVEVHAWGLERCVEYLTVLCRAAGSSGGAAA